jgi:hypothetical protein
MTLLQPMIPLIEKIPLPEMKMLLATMLLQAKHLPEMLLRDMTLLLDVMIWQEIKSE